MGRTCALLVMLTACGKNPAEPSIVAGPTPGSTAAWVSGPTPTGASVPFENGSLAPLTDLLILGADPELPRDEADRILSQPGDRAWWGIDETDRLLASGHLVWNVAELSGGSLRLGQVGLNLQDGMVADEHLRGDMIAPLYDALVARNEATREVAFAVGRQPNMTLGLRADPSVPWHTFMQVVYTAGQARYGSTCLLGQAHPATTQIDAFCVEMPEIGGPDTPMPPAVRLSTGQVSVLRADGAVDVPCTPECDWSVVGDALGDAPAVAVAHSVGSATVAHGMVVADRIKGMTGARIVVAPMGLADPTPLTGVPGLLSDPADLVPRTESSIRDGVGEAAAGD